MLTVNLDECVVAEVSNGAWVYSAVNGSFVEWAEIQTADRDTIATLRGQIEKSAGELSALIQLSASRFMHNNSEEGIEASMHQNHY